MGEIRTKVEKITLDFNNFIETQSTEVANNKSAIQTLID